MILKRDKKEESEKLDPKDREELETYKRGVAGGVTGAVVGGLAAGFGHAFEKIKKKGEGEVKGKVRERLKEVSGKLSESNLRKAKGLGLIAAGSGAALAAGSGLAYGIKKRKVKRKAEEGENDSTKE